MKMRKVVEQKTRVKGSNKQGKDLLLIKISRYQNRNKTWRHNKQNSSQNDERGAGRGAKLNEITTPKKTLGMEDKKSLKN